jgi:Luciferase-like monooxygenase
MFSAFEVDPTSLIARFTEGLRLMKACWTEPRITFSGRFWQLDDASMEPKPFQKPYPPLWIGANHPRAVVVRCATATASLVAAALPPRSSLSRSTCFARSWPNHSRMLHSRSPNASILPSMTTSPEHTSGLTPGSSRSTDLLVWPQLPSTGHPQPASRVCARSRTREPNSSSSTRSSTRLSRWNGWPPKPWA